MNVTKFHDMHSGGKLKTDYDHIYIEAPREQAIEFFKSWFNRRPRNVTCSCCGEDFSVTQYEDLAQATAYERNCRFERVDGEQGGGHWVEEPDTWSNGEKKDYSTVQEYLGQQNIAFFSVEDVENELNEVVEGKTY